MTSTDKPLILTAEERKEVTIQTVIALAQHKNPATITTAEIAEGMALTQGAIFRHFPNKDAIFEATIRFVTQQLLKRLTKAANSSNTSLEAIEKIFMAHVAFIKKYPGAPRLILSELQRSETSLVKRLVATFIKEYRQRIAKLITDGIEGGEFQADIDVGAATLLFVGSIHGLVLQTLVTNDTSILSKEAPRLLKIFLNSIKVKK